MGHSTKKKYTGEQRARVIHLIYTEGLSIRKAAREAGVPVATAEKWKQKEELRRKETGGNPTSPGAGSAPTSSNPSPMPSGPTLPPHIIPGKVERNQSAGGGGAAAGAGAGGAEGAAKAAGLGGDGAGPGPGMSPPPPPPPPRPEAPQIPADKALVGLSAVTLYLVGRTYCIKYKVPFNDEMKAVVKISEEEAAMLAEYAPYCAPLLISWLQRFGPYIGGAIYVGSLWSMLDDRVSIIKAQSPMFDEEGKLKPEYTKGRPKKTAPKKEGPHQAATPQQAAAVVKGASEALADLWRKMEDGGEIPSKA